MFGRTLDHLSLLCIPILFIRDNENTCLWCQWKCNYCLVAKLCLTLCNPMDYSTPLSPRVFSNSCPPSQWCYITISFVTHFSFCLRSFPASGSFPKNSLFASGGQSIGKERAGQMDGTPELCKGLPSSIWWGLFRVYAWEKCQEKSHLRGLGWKWLGIMPVLTSWTERVLLQWEELYLD